MIVLNCQIITIFSSTVFKAYYLFDSVYYCEEKKTKCKQYNQNNKHNQQYIIFKKYENISLQ